MDTITSKDLEKWVKAYNLLVGKQNYINYATLPVKHYTK